MQQLVQRDQAVRFFQEGYCLGNLLFIGESIGQNHHQLTAALPDMTTLLLAEKLVENRFGRIFFRIQVHQGKGLTHLGPALVPRCLRIKPKRVHMRKNGTIILFVKITQQLVGGQMLPHLHQHRFEFVLQVGQFRFGIRIGSPYRTRGDGFQIGQTTFQAQSGIVKPPLRFGGQASLQGIAATVTPRIDLVLECLAATLGYAVRGIQGDAARHHHQQESRSHSSEASKRLVAAGPFHRFLQTTDGPGLDRIPPPVGGQVVSHFVGSLVAFGGIFFQSLEGDGLQVERGSRIQVKRGNRFFLANMFQSLQQCPPLERRPAGEELIQHGPQRINVGQASEFLRLAFGLLWGHVARRSHDGAGAGMPVVSIHFLSQAEVSHLGQVFLGEQNIGRLQVAVDDIQRMRMAHCPAQLLHQPCCELGILRLSFEAVVERSTLDKFQGHVGQPLVFPHIENTHDVGVLHQCHCPCLKAKAVEF